MRPGRHNFPGHKAGSRFSFGFSLCDEADVPVSLVGYTAKFRIASPANPKVFIEATTANGGVVLGGAPYNVLVGFDLALAAGDYAYDLVLITADNKQLPVLTGDFSLEASTV